MSRCINARANKYTMKILSALNDYALATVPADGGAAAAARGALAATAQLVEPGGAAGHRERLVPRVLGGVCDVQRGVHAGGPRRCCAGEV